MLGKYNKLSRPKYGRLPAMLLVACASIRAAPSASQAPVVISTDSVPCTGCHIQMVLLAQLGTAGGSGYLEELPAGMAANSRGEIITVGPGMPRVFDLSGALLKVLGTEGDGPGEFRHPHAVEVTNLDTVHVFDGTRVTVYGPDWSFVRVVTLRRMLSWPSVLKGGSLVGHGKTLPGPNPPHLVRVVSPSGEEKLQFGPLGIRSANGSVSYEQRKTADSPSGGFWVYPGTPYEALLYDQQGGELLRFVRRVSHHPGLPLPARPSTQRPRPTTVHALREDRSGRIWVSIVSGRPLSPDQPMPDLTHYLTYCCTSILEVIDPMGGALVASKPVDGAIYWLLRGGLIGVAGVTDVGEPIVNLYRATLIGAG